VQSINDGKLEVVALYSSFHMAQLQVGLSKPHRIGQANNVKVFILIIQKIFLYLQLISIVISYKIIEAMRYASGR